MTIDSKVLYDMHADAGQRLPAIRGRGSGQDFAVWQRF